MPTISYTSSPPTSPGIFWFALGLAVLGLALLAALLLWWRQRRDLQAVHAQAADLRTQLQSLRQKHEVLESAVRASPLVAFRCGPGIDGAVQYIAESIEALTGWPAQAFTAGGKRLADILHPDDLQALQRQWQAPDRPSDLLRFECRLRHRDGRLLWVHGHAAPRAGAQGAAIEGALLNAQERKALEQKLHEREHLYSSLIASIPGVAYRCTPDENWQVIFISEVVRTLSGWTPADYMASPTLLRELVHVDEQPRVRREIQEAIDRDQGYTLEYRALRRDGSEFWAWEQGSAVRDAAGQVVWLDGVIIDISERKAMELALREAKDRAEQAAAAKTLFLTNMGHEVRTPLNAIIGFSEVVLRSELDAVQRQYVFKVRQAARALLRLVSDILDMARLERGQLDLVHRDFSLPDLAHEALAAHRAAAERKGLDLQLVLDPALHEHVRGDAARLGQVLDKLLDNAVKFTERGSVRLQLAPEPGGVLLAVHDTGIGIAPERQASIFEAFTQGDATATRRFEGTGLGTTLALQLVQRMGGTLQLHSTPGVGSVFQVHVPLVQAAEPVMRATGPATPAQPPLPERSTGPAALDAGPDRPWHVTQRQAIDALRNGDHSDAGLAALLDWLRGQGLVREAAQVEQALAMFDLDRAAELLETLPARF